MVNVRKYNMIKIYTRTKAVVLYKQSLVAKMLKETCTNTYTYSNAAGSKLQNNLSFTTPLLDDHLTGYHNPTTMPICNSNFPVGNDKCKSMHDSVHFTCGKASNSITP